MEEWLDLVRDTVRKYTAEGKSQGQFCETRLEWL